jgi:hypothetical protein
MAHGQQLQRSRYELKYLIDESLVQRLRDFTGTYLEPDEHALEENGWEYAVHSLYLDSPSFALCRATLQGHKNRYKLRIRFYDLSSESPAFFEIKRRVSDVILKQRARVRRDAVEALLAGDMPNLSCLANGSAGNGNDLGALQEFCSLRDMIGARPQLFVSYLREAYVTQHDNSVRVTFDRRICGMPYRGRFQIRGFEDPVFPNVAGVILELKFTDRFPNWIRQMVQVFELERRAMAKYVTCVRTLSRHPHCLQQARELRV